MELKIRAWHKERKKYYEVSEIDFILKVVEVIDNLINDFRLCKFEEVIIEQYTGLKNKSGEMCIGDIVKTSHGNLYVSTYRGSLVFRDKDDIRICLVDDTYYENTITIGTINENKELL